MIFMDRSKDLICHYAILLYWELILYYQLHASLSEVSVYHLLFLVPIAFVLSGLSRWSTKKRVLNGFLHTLLIFAVSLFYLGDLIYYKSFGSLVSVSMLGAGTDAVTNFWWSLKSTLAENIPVIFLYEIPVILDVLITFFRRKRQDLSSRFIDHPVLIVLAFALWFSIVAALPLSGTQEYTPYGAYHSRYVDTDTASGKLGILPNFLVELRFSLIGGTKYSSSLQAVEYVEMEEEEEEEVPVIEYNEYEGLDFNALAPLSENKEISTLCEYLGTVSPNIKNQYTGLFEGYNLIYICAESFSSLAIDEAVTPTLYRMANNGIVLNNYYNSFRNVTTNGEYAFLTGLWPDVARQETNMGKVTGTMGQSIGKDMSMALGNMFRRSEGIEPRAYHNYLGYYYGRNQTLPNMGFTCKFMNEGMKFTTAWPASDFEMMEQSVDDYINDEQFCTYYMTFSGHGNYTTDNVMVSRNLKTVTPLFDRYLPTSAQGYLSANYELEKAMTYLLERLEDAGKLDKTVIVLTGDHYPYYLTNPAYEALSGEKFDENFGIFKSSCIIYTTGLNRTIEVDTPCCNVDILPTILNLFGIDYDSRLYAGTDIFSNGFHIAQLYNRNFISDYVRYNNATGAAEWFIDVDDFSGEQLDSYLNNAVSTVRNRYAMSIEIEDTDFYRFVFSHYDISKNR